MKRNSSAGFSPPGETLLTRSLPAIALCGIVALSWAGTGTRGAAEATSRMERLAGKIERAEVLHPATVQQLQEILDMPQYDCGRVGCRAGLETRNQAARARLEQAIAKIDRRQIVVAGHPHD